jgi:hypothetical protein
MPEHARTTPAKPAWTAAKTPWPPSKTAAATFTWAAIMLHGLSATPPKHVIFSKLCEHSLFLSIMS